MKRWLQKSFIERNQTISIYSYSFSQNILIDISKVMKVWAVLFSYSQIIYFIYMNNVKEKFMRVVVQNKSKLLNQCKWFLHDEKAYNITKNR